MLPTILAIAALAVPMLVWLVYMLTEKQVYSGKAGVLNVTRYLSPAGTNAFVDVLVPEVGVLTADISVARLKYLSRLPGAFEVQVTVHRRITGGAWLQTITWPDGVTEDGTVLFDGLLLTVYYFIAGIACLGGVLWASGVAFILTGFISGNVLRKDVNLKGRTGTKIYLVVMGLLLGVCAVFLFQQFTILTLFLGLPVAFSVGQISGMLSR